MVKLTSAAVAVIALIGLMAVTSSAHSPSAGPCIWPNSPKIGKMKQIAKNAWKKADGPGRKQKKLYRKAKNCAPHSHNIKSVWKKAKKRYAPLREKKRLWRKCGNGSRSAVDACIDYAAEYKGGDGGWMHRVAYCESTKNPYASNGTHHGLFQYHPHTWGTTPYGGKSIWSARWQSLATAWMLSQGRSGEWACA